MFYLFYFMLKLRANVIIVWHCNSILFSAGNAKFRLHDFLSSRVAALFTLHDYLGQHSVAAVFTHCTMDRRQKVSHCMTLQ